MHLRATVNHCPSCNGGVCGAGEHGSINVGIRGRRDVLKLGFGTIPGAPPEAVIPGNLEAIYFEYTQP